MMCVDNIPIKNSFTVCILNTYDGSYTHIYEYVENIEKAYALAQYAMNHDRHTSDGELIFIFPGSNIGIERYSDDLQEKIKKWAEEYKSEDRKPTKPKNYKEPDNAREFTLEYLERLFGCKIKIVNK